MKRAQKVRRVACPDCTAAAGAPCAYPNGQRRATNHIARVKAHTKAYPPVPSIHADGGAARDYYGREHKTPAGRAAYGTLCPRCDEPMQGTGDMVKTSRGWIHRACAPGGDDE